MTLSKLSAILTAYAETLASSGDRTHAKEFERLAQAMKRYGALELSTLREILLERPD